jgi:hypothetical protein
MKLTLKLTSPVRTLALLPMLGLCLVLTGCEDLMVPQGMMNVEGTVTAVNATDRTVEIKTAQGETMVIAVTDTTTLQKASVLTLMPDKNITVAEIQVGKYLESTCSKEPVNGKHIATDMMIYNSKWQAD